MLEEFLDKLGKTMGKTYTPSEFKKIIAEAMAVEDVKVADTKKEEKTSDKKNK